MRAGGSDAGSAVASDTLGVTDTFPAPGHNPDAAHSGTRLRYGPKMRGSAAMQPQVLVGDAATKRRRTPGAAKFDRSAGAYLYMEGGAAQRRPDDALWRRIVLESKFRQLPIHARSPQRPKLRRIRFKTRDPRGRAGAPAAPIVSVRTLA